MISIRENLNGSSFVFYFDCILTVVVVPVLALPLLLGVVMALPRPVLVLVVLTGQDVHQGGELETH